MVLSNKIPILRRKWKDKPNLRKMILNQLLQFQKLLKAEREITVLSNKTVISMRKSKELPPQKTIKLNQLLPSHKKLVRVAKEPMDFIRSAKMQAVIPLNMVNQRIKIKKLSQNFLFAPKEMD